MTKFTVLCDICQSEQVVTKIHSNYLHEEAVLAVPPCPKCLSAAITVEEGIDPARDMTCDDCGCVAKMLVNNSDPGGHGDFYQCMGCYEASLLLEDGCA